MNNKHDLLIFDISSGLSIALHFSTRILILKNGEWRSLGIRFKLEQNS